MATQSRGEAIAILEDGWERVDRLVRELSGDALTRPATIGGGDWSATDLVGHLAAWEELALRTIREWRQDELPWVERPEGPLGTPGGVDRYNARTIEERRVASPSEVLAGSRQTHRALIRAIEELSDERWNEESSHRTAEGTPIRLSSLLGAVLAAPRRPFGHPFAHLPDLEAYVRSLR